MVARVVLPLCLSLLLAAAAGADGGRACRQGISRDTTERVFALLQRDSDATDCIFAGVDTEQSRLAARWSRAGVALPPLEIFPRECAPPGSRRTGAFAIRVPAEVTASCPSVASRLEELLDGLAGESAAGGRASASDPLYRAGRGLFVVLLVLAIASAADRFRRGRSADWGGLALALAAGAAAFAVRALLPFTLGNWYAEVLPAAGPPPWMRFGPGLFAFQSLLRDLGLWGPRALELSQLLLGAAAAPLLFGILRELRVGTPAAAATLVLLVLAPIHAVLSATPSEHLLASTLCLALLYCWLHAARSGESISLALAFLLLPAVCASRVDMAISAALVLPWPLLRDRAERGGLRGWPLVWRTILFGLWTALVLAGAYFWIALPSHHPLPDASAGWFATRASLRQLWLPAAGEPAWITAPASLLAAIGAAAMVWRRPLLLLRIAAILFVTVFVLGRPLLADELLGARYYLFAIPIFLIAAGQGFELVLDLVPRRARGVGAIVGLIVLAAWTAYGARSAYSLRYAFQDEYAFLAAALRSVPSGCTVYQVPMRSEAFPRDLDCCLDSQRSPLVLAFPDIAFADLPDDLGSVREGGCAAYYESIACEIRDDPGDPAVHSRAAGAADYLQRRCAEVHRVGRLLPLAESTTSPRATVPFFAAPPRVALYLWNQ